ncbi:hypothetical protein LYSHEL_15700 [Lysobacter helvus]|uniref:Uncharacterized protein n=2 Tax=Lysobacteraceae TaxID=32033 RepID=A0ABN6FS96_9GAMM|nr:MULTISPECIES: hypothetical protein [Lysobacter]BCT92546.1 hypothetical protein LYSCAS_15700 [Lysobacter caseinilyticus]BCT95699.1 hypothetical protein LYSHEL_15700 [Lysobacter helvus]
MNTEHFDPRDELEWQAQERARLAARAGMPATDDPLADRYRVMAEVLRGPLPDALPVDFAAQVARRASMGAQADARFESILMRTILAVFGLSAAVVVAVYGHAWVAPILEALKLDSAVAVNWALALGACIGASWLTDQLRKHWHAPHAA